MAATVAGVRSHRELLDMAMHSAGGRRDPYPFLAELLTRDGGCVLDDGRSFAYGYRQCTAVLRSPTFLKHGEHASSVPSGITAQQAETLRRERPEAPGMLSSIDDPAHSRLRRLVSLAFTPRRLEPYVALISKTLDELLAGLDPTEPVDLVSTVNSQIPSQVVGELIGLPSLARLEGDVVYSEMLRRYPRMELAGEPARQDTFRARAFSEIPIVLEPS